MHVQALAENGCDASIPCCWTQGGSLRAGSLAARTDMHWQSLVRMIDAWQVCQQVLGCNFPLAWPQNDLRWVAHQELGQRIATSMLRCVIFRGPFALSMEQQAILW